LDAVLVRRCGRGDAPRHRVGWRSAGRHTALQGAAI